MKKSKRSPIDDFIALPDAEKERIYNEIDSMSHEEFLAKSRPLTDKQWAYMRALKKNMKRGPGRPKLGKDGVQKVSISVERSLMQRVDRYAQAHDMKRSELFARGVAAIIGV